MSNTFINSGIDSIPLTGGQAGIITDENFTKARVIRTKVDSILNILKANKVPVITGFQGISEEGYFTTLGRGGSDTSACILGAALEAEYIEIYTDVDGMMTADPRIVSKASLIDKISYNEVFQLADQGAKVIHPLAVRFAEEERIPILIKNTMSNSEGTLINELGNTAHKLISGITYLNNRIQVTLKLKDNLNNNNYRFILDKLANNKISLDLINIFPKEQIFTIDSSNKEKTKVLLNNLGIKYNFIENCSTIAIVGIGMTGIPGIMAKIVNTLSENNIEILQTADSKMTIWCLVNSINVNKALNSLHETFNLNE